VILVEHRSPVYALVHLHLYSVSAEQVPPLRHAGHPTVKRNG
jgi:hypothetical protein